MCSNASGDPLTDLESALERLAVHAQNRLDAQVARSVREGELIQAAVHDGLKTMQSFAAGHRDPRPALRVHRLRRRQLLVRRSARPAPDRWRRHLPGQRSPALRTPPHKVHHGFRISRLPDGRWRTWRPDGTEILLSRHLLAA
jgi:hypothetical protein